MFKFNHAISLSVTLVLTALLPFNSVTAEPDHHSGGRTHHMGSGMKTGDHAKHHNNGDRKKGEFTFRNAAGNYLSMSKVLELTSEQTNKLVALRDNFDKENALAIVQQKSAKQDLVRLIYSENIDLKEIDTVLAKIGKLEGKIWHDFVRQMKDIQTILTNEQKDKIKHRRGYP